MPIGGCVTLVGRRQLKCCFNMSSFVKVYLRIISFAYKVTQLYYTNLQILHPSVRTAVLDMEEDHYRVFVYGTLKTGQPNHHFITDKENGEAKLLGRAQTVDKFPLVIANKFRTPLRSENKRYREGR